MTGPNTVTSPSQSTSPVIVPDLMMECLTSMAPLARLTFEARSACSYTSPVCVSDDKHVVFAGEIRRQLSGPTTRV